MIRVSRITQSPASVMVINLNTPGPERIVDTDEGPAALQAVEVQTILATPARADGVPTYTEILPVELANKLKEDPGLAKHFAFEDVAPGASLEGALDAFRIDGPTPAPVDEVSAPAAAPRRGRRDQS